MRYNKIFLTTVAAVLLLAGCSEDVVDGRGGKGAVPVLLTATMECDGSELVTRAGTSLLNSFSSGDVIKAYFPSNVRVGSTTSGSSTTYSYNGTSWSPATQPYFNEGASSCTVHAYYPSSHTNTTSSFSVQLDQSSTANYKASDLMYATTSISKSSPSGSLTFAHRMAKVMVSATAGTGVSQIQGVYIINGKRTINISTPQSCTLGSTLSNDLSTSTKITMYSGGTSSSASCAALIPPQTINGNFLQIVTDQGTATYSLSSKQFESAKSYQLNITVNQAAIGTTVAITNWTGTGNVTIQPTGELTIEPISDVTYNGSAWTPSLTVKKDGTTLTQNATNGYTCQWFNNTNAGTAFVIVRGQGTYDGSEAVAKFTINKANAAVTAAPTIRSTYYTGGSLQIINAGSCTGGTMRYKLGSGSWTTDATEIVVTSTGNYTVYWKVDGDANHNSVAETSFVVAVTYPPMSSATSSHVGKVICTSGHIHSTVSEATAAGCTASGIIAYVGSAGTADKSTNSGSYKGLALALYDYGGSLTSDGTTCKWYTADGGTCITNGRSNTVATAIGTTGDFGKGIDNTNRLATAACGSGHTHAAAQNAKNFSVARPTGASQWFLPTMYQWNLMVKAMCGKSTDLTTSTNNDYKADKFNEKITAAGGRGVLSSYYWSSVEYSADYAWDMYFYYGYANGYGKSFNNRVRAVFAF